MDIKKIKSLMGNGRKNGKRSKRAADRLAPLEEQKGLLVFDEEDFKASQDLIEKSDEVRWRDLLRFEPIVIFILVFAIGFIAYIAWQIQFMPPVAK